MAKKFRERFKTQENVFDRFTIRNLFVLGSRKFLEEDTLSPISIGKEANVFSARSGEEKVAVKIYRLETADYRKMFDHIRADPRYENLAKKRREIIFSWAQREYRNLLAARNALVSAPLPLTFMKNILVMKLVGEENAAPKLKDAIPENPDEFLKLTIAGIRKFYGSGYVHGDLSKFNILNSSETPVLIDFSQATLLRDPNSDRMLKRDVRNVCGFFTKLGVEADTGKIYDSIRKDFSRD